MMTEFARSALRYHEHPLPGKISTAITKPASTPDDPALACSPGVAEPVKAIQELARLPVPGGLLALYGLKQLSFEKDYIIPMPLDPRLLTQVASPTTD